MRLKIFNKNFYPIIWIFLANSSHLSAIPHSFGEFKENFQRISSDKTVPNKNTISYKYDPIKGTRIKIDKSEFVFRTFKIKKDQDFLKSLYQNPLITRTLMTSGQALSDQAFSNLLNYWQGTKSAFTVYIIENKNKEPIGVFELLKNNNTLEVSYIINRSFQNQGWGTKVMKTVMDDLIPLLKNKSVLENISCLIGYVLQTNIPSLKILRSVGFVPKVDRKDIRLPDSWKLFEFPL